MDHSKVNLRRLVPILERSADEWDLNDSLPGLQIWVKAAGKLEVFLLSFD